MAMLQIRTAKFDTEVIDEERVLSADISELQIAGFPEQFQLITSGGVKVMMEREDTIRDADQDISMVAYKPMSPAFGRVRVIIFND